MDMSVRHPLIGSTAAAATRPTDLGTSDQKYESLPMLNQLRRGEGVSRDDAPGIIAMGSASIDLIRNGNVARGLGLGFTTLVAGTAKVLLSAFLACAYSIPLTGFLTTLPALVAMAFLIIPLVAATVLAVPLTYIVGRVIGLDHQDTKELVKQIWPDI